MSALPNLAGVATADLVEKIEASGRFSASYINWSRTMHLLRTYAPGWLPDLELNSEGGILHAAPVGCYLMIRFRNGEEATPAVPQAVMDSRNAAIQHDKITARDVSDTHRRGVCMAAALTFGLAYELWAKMPLESGYHDDSEHQRDACIRKIADACIAKHAAGNEWGVHEEASALTDNEDKLRLWEMLREHSAVRATIKRMAEQERAK